MPAWLMCFVGTFALFLAQAFPLTGAFLMMLAAPYWSVVLVNLGFALLLADAVRGRAPRVLVALPLLWFGGYEAAAWASHRQAAAFVAAIDRANAGRRVAWDPAAQDLLVAFGPGDDAGMLPVVALVGSYGLARAFERHDHANGASETLVNTIFTPCPEASEGAAGNAAVRTSRTVWAYEPAGPGGERRQVRSDDVCEGWGPARPDRPVTTVTLGERRFFRSLLREGTERAVDVRSPAGAVALRAGGFAPLSWFPQPVLGCALDDGNSKWACTAEFDHDHADEAYERRPLAVAVAALGLAEVPLRQRFPDARWR